MAEYRAIYKCPLCGKVFENDKVTTGGGNPNASIYQQHKCTEKIFGAALLVGIYEVGAEEIEDMKNKVEANEFGCLYREEVLPMSAVGGRLTMGGDKAEFHTRFK